MIKAMIVDDEQPSLDKLEKLLADSGLALVQGKFTEPFAALGFLKENQTDAVFLDIEMSDMDGIALATRILDLQGGVSIVFVTAYNKYAVEAFRLNALDYLLKPVTEERLRETLGRILERKSMPVHAGSISIQCFGRFCVKVGSEEIRFRTEKAEELLAYLVHFRGNYVSRDQIIDSLWGEFEGDRAVVNFNTTLHYIKKALLSYGIKISILYDRGNYRIETGSLACDYLKFSNFRENVSNACAGNIEQYKEAVCLYGGDYLSGRDFDWADGKRLMLEEQFIELLLEMARYYTEAGSEYEAAECLKKGLLIEPLHRGINYRLIEALLRSRERAMAVKYFELYRKGLAKKLKTEPDEDFKKLLK